MNIREKGLENIRGIKISTLAIGLMVTASILFLAILLSSLHMQEAYQGILESNNGYAKCLQAAKEMQIGSDYLTEQVQMYVMTGQAEYMENYFKEVNTTKRRDTAVATLEEYFGDDESYTHLKKSLELSNELKERECYAMRLYSEGKGLLPETLPKEVAEVEMTKGDAALNDEEKITVAREMIFDSTYAEYKEEISRNADACMTELVEIAKTVQQNSEDDMMAKMTHQQELVILLFIMSVFAAFMIFWFVIRPLKIYISCIKNNTLFEAVGAYEFKRLALTYNNIMDINQSTERILRHQAEHDGLTGLINRGAYENLRNVFEHCANTAFLMLDVDEFKKINDTYGHEGGDAVLKNIAQLLQGSFRSSDYIARVGGDEFSVIMTDIKPEQCDKIIDKVKRINAQIQEPDDPEIPKASISVGIAFVNEKDPNQDVYKDADEALYAVKNHGRSNVAVYSEIHK